MIYCLTDLRLRPENKKASCKFLQPAFLHLESERMFPDESWQREFLKAGRYDYTCGPHPEMKGAVIVRE